jgi:hypothetical protein
LKLVAELVVRKTSVPPPPRPLGVHGMGLWNAIQGEFAITDCGGRLGGGKKRPDFREIETYYFGNGLPI